MRRFGSDLRPFYGDFHPTLPHLTDHLIVGVVQSGRFDRGERVEGDVRPPYPNRLPYRLDIKTATDARS